MYSILKNSYLFKDITEKDIIKFIESSNSFIKTLSKDDIVFKEGDSPQYLYMLLSGSVSINKITQDGRNILLTVISNQGDLFGEVYALLNDATYSFFASSLENNTKILYIPKAIFKNPTNSNLIINMLHIFAHKAYFLTEKMAMLSLSSIREKLAHLILKDISIDNTYKFRLTREELAQYLGISRPSLSRELSNMAKQGLFKVKKDTLYAIDFLGLEKILYK